MIPKDKMAAKTNAHTRAMRTSLAMKQFMTIHNMNGPSLIPGLYLGPEVEDPDLSQVDVDGETFRYIPRGTPAVPTAGDVVMIVNFPGVYAFIGWIIKGNVALADQGDF